MIPPQQKEILRIPDLIGQQQTYTLNGLLATIHIIAQKQIVGGWGQPPILKDPQQVAVLAVNVAADLDGGCEL
jgi:hypothetical protein